MTRKRDRFFAGFGALLFLVTASAVTIAVIVNGISNHNKSPDTSAQTTPTNTAGCEETSIDGKAEATPAVYKPTGTVTQVQTTDLAAGSGAAVKSGDCLQVKYYGTLASDGTVFDENFDKASEFQFVLGKGQVIAGWDKGLVGATVGSTRRLVIPAADAYGAQGQGTIPPNADLVFVVKIVAVKP